MDAPAPIRSRPRSQPSTRRPGTSGGYRLARDRPCCTTGLSTPDPSPVIQLNRAVAVSMAFGPQDGLRLIDELGQSASRTATHLWHSARASLLLRLDQPAQAADAYRRALALATNPVDRRFLEREIGRSEARTLATVSAGWQSGLGIGKTMLHSRLHLHRTRFVMSDAGIVDQASVFRNPSVVGIGIASLFSDVGHEIGHGGVPRFLPCHRRTGRGPRGDRGRGRCRAVVGEVRRRGDRRPPRRRAKDISWRGPTVTALGYGSFALAHSWPVVGIGSGDRVGGARDPVART